jgi:polysaccharide export outer membrane protein
MATRILPRIVLLFGCGTLCGFPAATVAQGQVTTANSSFGAGSSAATADNDGHASPAEGTSTSLPGHAATASRSTTGDGKMRADSTPQELDAKAADSYVVGIADDLQISVWKEPDLSGPVVVRPDGMITVPVVNDVHVAGLTTKQVQALLTEKLQQVVNDPQVTVIVRTIRSRKVFLVGQVGHPGSVSLTGKETILQVVAEAGGLGPYAKGDKIYVLRTANGRQERLNFNYRKALKGADPKSDFQLMSGDVIVVP